MMLKERILELLYPPRCVLCGKVLEKHQSDFCESCRTESRTCPRVHHSVTFLDSWLSVWYYEGYIRRSLLRFKFHRKRMYAAAYGRMLALRVAEDYPEGFDVLTWVPVSRLRKWKRGYTAEDPQQPSPVGNRREGGAKSQCPWRVPLRGSGTGSRKAGSDSG